MKKTFYVLACIMAVAAMVMTGCQKDNDGDNNGGNGGTNTDTPTTPDTPGGGQTTTFNEWTVGADSMAVANGNGTLTIGGQTHSIVMGHLSEVNVGGSVHTTLQFYDSYKPSIYLAGDYSVSFSLDQALETGTYTCDNTETNYVNDKNVGTYRFPAGTTFNVTRIGNYVTVSIEATNVGASNMSGNEVARNDISFSYSGSVYYMSYGM